MLRSFKCPNCNCDLEVMDNILKIKDKKILIIDDDDWYAMDIIDRDLYIVFGYDDQTQQHRVIEK